jgi:hypothetical protein
MMPNRIEKQIHPSYKIKELHKKFSNIYFRLSSKGE